MAGLPLRPGKFPDAVRGEGEFDAIVMLAVLEHISAEEHPGWADACDRHLRLGGFLIITVPSPVVDHILTILLRLRLLHGMDSGAHHGFHPADTLKIFTSKTMRPVHASKFQFGLNNLFVFQKYLT